MKYFQWCSLNYTYVYREAGYSIGANSFYVPVLHYILLRVIGWEWSATVLGNESITVHPAGTSAVCKVEQTAVTVSVVFRLGKGLEMFHLLVITSKAEVDGCH